MPKVEEPAPVVVAEPELKPVERQEPPVVQQTPEAHKPVESPAASKISLNDVIEKKSLIDFRKAISLNDWFRFKRDLFKGNEEAINATVQALSRHSTVSVPTRRPSPILTSMHDGIRTIRRRLISSSSSRNDFYKPTLI